MRRGLQIAGGIAVLFTTLGFTHIMFHDTRHMLEHRDEGHLFVTIHTIVAIVVILLSFTGAYFLLTGARKPPTS